MKYKITPYIIKYGNCKGWYDYYISYDGVIIQSYSGTAFETKQKAKDHGIFIISEIKK